MIRSILSAAAALVLAAPAMAWPISPENAAKVLTNAGSEDAEVVWLSDEVARIDAKVDDFFYSVRMMNCTEDKTCGSAMLFATFTMEGAPDMAMYEKTNLYNDSYPFGRAFILDEPGSEGYTVGVDYTVDLRNEHNLDAEDLGLFRDILPAYTGHMSE